MPEQDPLIEQARAKAQSQKWTPEKVISDLDPNDLFDHKFLEWCNTVRSELVSGLKQALWTVEDEYSRLNISHLLLQLGEVAGSEGIIDCLHSSDTNLHVSVLATLSVLPMQPLTENSPSWQRPPVPIQKEALFTALEPFLDKPDSHPGSIALDVALNLALPQAGQRIARLLKHPSQQVRAKVASRFLQRGEDKGALEVVETLLFKEICNRDEISRIVSALESCSKEKNLELAQQAANLLVQFILANLARLDNLTANCVLWAMRGLEAVHHPGESQILQTILQSSIEYWVRGIALERLSKLEGEAGLTRLQLALSDVQLREYAARGIAKVAKGREDSTLIDNLVSVFQEETRPQVLGAIIDALIEVGGNVVSSLEQSSNRLAPYDAMRIAWLTKGITPQMAVTQLANAGVISIPSRDLLGQLEEQWQAEHQPSTVIFSLLDASGRLTGFDRETAVVPVDHVRLIENFLEISSDRFKVEAVSQSWPQENEESNRDIEGYQVQFVYNSKVYCFTAQFLGDWYDVDAVVQALNHSLEEAEQQERFFLLYTGDQTCLVTFAPEAAFQEVACELHIPFGNNFQSAMN